MPFTSQVLSQYFSCGVHAMFQRLNSACDSDFIYMHMSSIKYLLSDARNCVCHHYCLTLVRFSCIDVDSSAKFSAIHMVVTSLRVIQLDRAVLSFAYLY
jgi:hypothetical protein